MRNCFLILFFLLEITVEAKEILKHISIKAGISNSQQCYTSNLWDLNNHRPNVNSILSPFINVEYRFDLRKNHSISIGTQLIQKGYTNILDFPLYGNRQQSLRYSNILSYVEFPILYSWSFKKMFSIKIGAIFSILEEANYRFREIDIVYNHPTIVFDSNYNYDMTYRYKRYDYGVNVGFSVPIINFLEFEFSLQKHFVNPDKWNANEVLYSQMYLIGFRYFL